MWKRFKNDSDKATSSVLVKKMRYFILYPPSNSIRLIDVDEKVRVEDILTLTRQEFGLKVDDTSAAESSIVLSYNGFDLKPKWSLTDLSIPSGAIIRCIYREKQAADLYIHCGFNKQILKLFDSSITMETNVSTIRKKISDKLGLPLSLFCLETYDGKQRLYDEMKLINYDIKIHDHVYLKVWKGYEKFICSCIKGFTEHYSHDDLIRHYQAQVALYIAAFYGHMELASSAMQHGARSDHPVGEHPSRQWSSEVAFQILPELLKCPIHIAIERGHIKIVDLFVRQSVLCTQIRDPIKGYLPYKLAMSFSMAAKTKEEKRCFNQIYFYLHDKQYNFKIPLNANGEYVSSLLTSTTTTLSIRRTLTTHYVEVSLPFYCRLMNWYERARERAWKKFGGRFYTSTTQTKRVYPKNGLLGYKVLIDGYNNTFEVPKEQLRGARSDGALTSDRYVGFSDEEREKILHMKTFMKQFAVDERQRAKRIAATNLQQSHRSPLLKHQTSTDLNKHPNTATQAVEGISSSSDFSNSQILSNISALNLKTNRPTDNPIQKEDSPRMSKTIPNGEVKRTLPRIVSSLSNSTRSEISTNKQPIMSSLDAYVISSTRLAVDVEQQKEVKRQELFTKIEQFMQQKPEESPPPSFNPLSIQLPANRSSILDIDSYVPLSDHPTKSYYNPLRSRSDLDIHQSTIQLYEHYANTSIRSTAIDCLREASHFKKKSWLQKVEISKEMVKHQVQRRLRRTANTTTSQKLSTTSFKTNIIKVT